MKLIIVEKRDIKGYLENLKERSLEFKEILGDYKIYSLYNKTEIIEITEKKNGKQFFLTHIFQEDAARNTSDEYFPFDHTKFNFKIIDDDKFKELNSLIEQSDTIIYVADCDRMGNSKFNSLIYSGLFNLENKKIFSAVNDEDFNDTSILNSFKNLKEQIQFSNELKEKTHTNVWSVEVEIALNEIDWKNPNLDLESRATISDEILEKYSNKYKYGVNIKEMKYYGYFFNKNNTLQILKNLKYNLAYHIQP